MIQQYVEALEESKADRATGKRVSNKSKVMDIHHTFEGIKSTVSPPAKLVICSD